MVDPMTLIAIAQATKSGYDLYKGHGSEKEQQHIAKYRERRSAKTAKKGTRELQRQLKKDVIPHKLSDLQERLQRSSKGANQFYEPVVQRAVNTFNQQTVPDVITKFGGAAGYGGSALQQALAQSAGNLSQQIAGDLAGAKERYAFNLMNMSNQNKGFNAQNRGQISQFSLSDPSAYIPRTNQEEQGFTNFGQAWTNLGNTEFGKKYPNIFGKTPPINPTTTNIGGGA